MATLSELLSDVRVEIAEPTEQYWTDEQLKKYINISARDFSSRVGLLQAPPVKCDIVGGTAAYRLPNDCPGPHAIVKVFYDTSTVLQPASVGSIVAGDGEPHDTTGTPAKWYPLTINGYNYIALYPIPSSSLTDGLVLWYWKLASNMTDDDDVCEIPDEFNCAVVYASAMRAWLAKKELAQAEMYRKMYEEECIRAKAWVNAVFAASVHDMSADAVRNRGIF